MLFYIEKRETMYIPNVPKIDEPQSKELAEINWETVDLKEKYWRMDASYSWYPMLLEETMEDYEALSEESCMYCNKRCKQYWTHEDSWVIHLCLPCLIGDKITILLERIITRWKERNDKSGWYTSFTYSG